LTFHAVSTAQQPLDLSYGLEDVRTVTVDGTELNYIARGAGPGSPVVLVHGQASDFRFWQALIEEGAEVTHPADTRRCSPQSNAQISCEAWFSQKGAFWLSLEQRMSA
jgi:hypothetical protein